MFLLDIYRAWKHMTYPISDIHHIYISLSYGYILMHYIVMTCLIGWAQAKNQSFNLSMEGLEQSVRLRH